MNRDPRAIIADSPMGALQIVVVALTIALNALDGFDVLSISFASPGIAQEWGIDRAALGIVLSMELIGMAIGSILLGGVADTFGRRPTILGCLVVMAGGMLTATTGPACPTRTPTAAPVLVSQTRAVLSSLPETIHRLSALKASIRTSPVCPRITPDRSLPVSRSKTRSE